MLVNIFIVITVLVAISAFDDFNYNDTEVLGHHGRSEVLSRRKRFLVFPEGSSFQLVFCVTTPVLVQIGDIFLMGYTAALAYELPQDPYSPFDHKADPLHRRVDSKTIYFTDEDGRVMYKRPYKRKPIVNPAFAKRSVDTSFASFKKGTQEKLKKINRKQMHASQHKREFLKSEHMGERSVEFHRNNRAGLYGKIESLFDGLGGDGRQCVLKTLCLVGQSQNGPQGSFLQEMMRVVFTMPKGPSEDMDNVEYDQAYFATHSCDDLYPGCKEPTTGTYHSNVLQN